MTTIHWWAKHAASRPLFLSVRMLMRTNKADARNRYKTRCLPKWSCNVASYRAGSCQWYAAVVDNAGNYRTMLEKEYHRYRLLIPESPFMDDKAPGKVKKVKMEYGRIWRSGTLDSSARQRTRWTKAVQYVVYRLIKRKNQFGWCSHIVAITRDHFYPLPL